LLREVYKQKIKDYQLEQEITIAGKKTREELCELFKDQDFVIQMPYQEPYGKVPIEGLFFGLIPILSDIGVSAAFTGKGQHGFLCSPGDVNTLADILYSLYNNQHRFINMIDKGRAFAFHNTLEHWAEAYHRVITSAYPDKI
jgi:glycosyltransferase involved in cell wall biosynthesis